jgi:ABC-type glycerol-3-phosphate transport system substrate-binding protein
MRDRARGMPRAVLLAVLGILSLFAISCGPPPEPTEWQSPLPVATGGAVRVTLWHPWRKSRAQALAQVIAAFQERQPGIQVDARYVPFDDLRAAYEAAGASGEGPMLLLGAAEWGPTLYDAGWLADVTALTSASLLAPISPVALEAVTYRGALIGLPHRLEGVVLFRNRAIMAEAPATMEDLIASAQAATEGDVVGAHLERGFFFSGGHLEGIGGELMDGEGNPQFNSEKGVEWIDLLRSFEEAEQG